MDRVRVVKRLGRHSVICLGLDKGEDDPFSFDEVWAGLRGLPWPVEVQTKGNRPTIKERIPFSTQHENALFVMFGIESNLDPNTKVIDFDFIFLSRPKPSRSDFGRQHCN